MKIFLAKLKRRSKTKPLRHESSLSQTLEAAALFVKRRLACKRFVCKSLTPNESSQGSSASFLLASPQQSLAPAEQPSVLNKHPRVQLHPLTLVLLRILFPRAPCSSSIVSHCTHDSPEERAGLTEPQFIDGETEAQGGQLTCPRSHGKVSQDEALIS